MILFLLLTVLFFAHYKATKNLNYGESLVTGAAFSPLLVGILAWFL